MTESQYSGFATRAIHVGQDPDALTGAVIPPIYATSTYAQDGVGGTRQGYEYGRTGNPTRSALEQALAALEGGRYARAFASGLAATDTLWRAVLRPGDHVLLPNDVYGGTWRLLDKVFKHWGVDHTAVPLSDIAAVRAAVQPNTKLIFVETPTNPLLNIADIAAIAQIAHSHDALLVVDNTFATPYLQNPFEFGADVVLHSTTKYIGGHSDLIGGALITSDAELDAKLAFLQNGVGAVPSAFDAWLTTRSLKTLEVRMEKHSDNAERVVSALIDHPKVISVLYPGLPDHPGHDIAAKQMRRFGGMISFRLKGGEQAALAVCAQTKLFTLAESLGGVESLIEHPGRMTHLSVAGSALEVPADLVRLSVGLESADDLIADLRNALD